MSTAMENDCRDILERNKHMIKKLNKSITMQRQVKHSYILVGISSITAWAKTDATSL